MTRTTTTSATVGNVAGDDYMDETGAHLDRLLDAGSFPISSIGGTANAVTGTVDAEFLDAGPVTGMKVTWTQGTTNTGSVTMALNSGSAAPVLDAQGSALAAGAVPAGMRVLAERVGSNWVVLSSISLGAAVGQPRYQWRFIANGTWTKPAGLSNDTLVTIIAVGPGGNGVSASGGGGGGAAFWIGRLGDLPSSVAVTVPGGGAGSHSLFGSLLTAYSGSNGYSVNGGSGGGFLGTGSGGAGAAGLSASGGNASSAWGGGGGGGSGGDGGDAFQGGGGGGITAGVSMRAGNGGGSGENGQIPGGGGGRSSGLGARGQVDVYL